MKDDAISRQAAIEALSEEIIKRRLLNDINDGMLDEFDTENILRKLSPVQQWVPLSTNQLPKEGQQVFIQFKEGRQCPHFKIQVGYLGEHDIEDNNFRKIGVKKVWYTNQYYYDLDRVVAWMPRPELYKEKEDETN